MKKIAHFLALPLLYVIAGANNLNTSEAARHVGENAIVCGVVAGVHTATSSKGSPTFVNLDKPYPNPAFTILIWGDDLRSSLQHRQHGTASGCFDDEQAEASQERPRIAEVTSGKEGTRP